MKKCPCCGFYTVDSDDEVIVDICDVCFWQYDVVAHEHPEISIGPNGLSLNEARINYKKYGACKKQFANTKFVRRPLDDELPELYEQSFLLLPLRPGIASGVQHRIDLLQMISYVKSQNMENDMELNMLLIPSRQEFTIEGIEEMIELHGWITFRESYNVFLKVSINQIGRLKKYKKKLIICRGLNPKQRLKMENGLCSFQFMLIE